MRNTIPFGEHLPDIAPLGHPGLIVADGAWASAAGYKPVGAFSPSVNGALGADCLGVASARSEAGTVFTVAGTASALQRYTASGWASIGTGGRYGAPEGLLSFHTVSGAGLVLCPATLNSARCHSQAFGHR